ncbi:hypothetical protein CER19_24290 [Pseudomonas sp. GL93]|nr:hypothetical protein CER19_24290 [Pseudomonas sp. GL93]
MKIPTLLLTQTAWAANPSTLRIDYQKGSIALVLAKEHGLLEKRFPQTEVKWIEFPAGPQMLEALNVGAEPPKPSAETLLVRNDSPVLPIDDSIIGAQQATADLFYQNRLLPKAIEVRKVIWRPEAR